MRDSELLVMQIGTDIKLLQVADASCQHCLECKSVLSTLQLKSLKITTVEPLITDSLNSGHLPLADNGFCTN